MNMDRKLHDRLLPRRNYMASPVLHHDVHIPLFKSGDVGGILYVLAGNIGNLILVTYTLLGFGWSEDLVFGKVIPGISVGLMLQGLYYAWMGYRLGKRTGNAAVTSLPSGISTPAMFVFLYGVIMPLQQGLELPPEQVWTATVAACFLGGAIEALGGLAGPYLRRMLPRAAMLATVAGIALVWMATKGFYDVYASPVLGMPILTIAVLGLFGGYMLPRKINLMLVAIIFGILYALVLGKASINVTRLGSLTLPSFSAMSIWQGMNMIMPFLALIIPIEIYNFIETMDNVEGAAAAGDEYSVREAQIVDGCSTMLSAGFGGIMPTTVWLGLAGLKKGGAGIGFSWVSGVLLGLCGFLGGFSFVYHLMPKELVAVTYLWCALIMISQAFCDSPKRYSAAIGIAFIPHLASYVHTQIMGVLTSQHIYALSPEVEKALLDAGVLWGGVQALSQGAIITGMMWAAMFVFVIDSRLDKAGHTTLVAAGLTFIGLIHSSSIGLKSFTDPFMLGYLSVAVIFYGAHLMRGKLERPVRFDYV